MASRTMRPAAAHRPGCRVGTTTRASCAKAGRTGGAGEVESVVMATVVTAFRR